MVYLSPRSISVHTRKNDCGCFSATRHPCMIHVTSSTLVFPTSRRRAGMHIGKAFRPASSPYARRKTILSCCRISYLPTLVFVHSSPARYISTTSSIGHSTTEAMGHRAACGDLIHCITVLTRGGNEWTRQSRSLPLPLIHLVARGPLPVLCRRYLFCGTSMILVVPDRVKRPDTKSWTGRISLALVSFPTQDTSTVFCWDSGHESDLSEQHMCQVLGSSVESVWASKYQPFQ